MCNKHYKLVVTVSILCYNGVFRTSFTSHCKCTIKRHQWEGYFKLRGCFEMFLIYKKCKYIVKQNNCKLKSYYCFAQLNLRFIPKQNTIVFTDLKR